jgi:hypothetical protein
MEPMNHRFVEPGPADGAYIVSGDRRLAPAAHVTNGSDTVASVGKPKPTPHPTRNLPPRTVASLTDGVARTCTVIDWDGSMGTLTLLGHEGVEVPFHAGVVRGNAVDRLAPGLTINASFGRTKERPGVRVTQTAIPSQKRQQGDQIGHLVVEKRDRNDK